MGDIEKAFELAGYHANGFITALAVLVGVLESRGLERGAYLAALKETMNSPEADFDRPDYVLLRRLAQLLEGHFDPPAKPPHQP